MPWNAKQLNLFRAAAHNPAIAKSSGIKQSDAERMSKEGLKKMAGGGKAMINRQDTKHGKMDMPFTNLSRYAGMKKGGMMKTRRFDEGGETSAHEIDPDSRRAHGLYDKEPTPKTVAKAAPKTPAKPAFKNYGDETDAGPKEDTSSVRNIRSFRKAPLPSKEQLDTNAERMAKIGEGVAMALPVGRVAKGVHDVGKAANAARRFGEAKNLAAPEAAAWKEFAAMPRKAIKTPSAKQFEKQINSGEIALKKGGMMKESKAMVGKEMAFMKKKGAPASMMKHEKAEMTGMKKFAKGGGIESRGKTKGTMVRMATGGVVKFAKGGGIELRGKTRGKMC
jgi:hypothetical protein